MIWNNMRIIVTILLVTTAIVSCDDQPLIFEEDEIPFREPAGNVIETTAVIDSTFFYIFDPVFGRGDSPNLMLGEYKDQESSILLRFRDIPANVSVDSARISFIPSYVYGEALESFTAHVFEVTSDWNTVTLPEVTVNPIEAASFQVSSSLEEVELVTIPADLAQKWVDATGDSTLPNYGILISSDNAGFAKQYIHDVSNPNGPVLDITMLLYYSDNGGQDIELLIPTATTYLVDGPKELENGLVLSNFGSHRAVVRFGIDHIPDNAIINFAEMVLVLDEDNSDLKSSETYSLQSNPLISKLWDPDNILLSIAAFQQRTIGLNSNTERLEVRFNILSLFQTWVNSRETNNGILFTSGTEGLDFSKFVYFFDTGDGGIQPTIQVQYTIFNIVSQ